MSVTAYYYEFPFEWSERILSFTGRWYITETKYSQKLMVEVVTKPMFWETRKFISSDNITWETTHPIQECNA